MKIFKNRFKQNRTPIKIRIVLYLNADFYDFCVFEDCLLLSLLVFDEGVFVTLGISITGILAEFFNYDDLYVYRKLEYLTGVLSLSSVSFSESTDDKIFC